MSKLIVNSKVFVRPETQNMAVNDLIGKVEKLTSIHLWLSKANQYLELYKRTLDAGDKATDEPTRTMTLINCEAYFMTAVSFYTRCFRNNQKGRCLQLRDVPEDAELRSCHEKLETLRHNEYVHWKGLRSNLRVFYSFEQIDDKDANFAQEVHVKYEEKLGPDEEFQIVHRLFNEMAKYVLLERLKLLKEMETLFRDIKIRSVTRLLDTDGNSIFKQE